MHPQRYKGVIGKSTLRAGSAPGGWTALGHSTSRVGFSTMLRVGTTGGMLEGGRASVGGDDGGEVVSKA